MTSELSQDKKPTPTPSPTPTPVPQFTVEDFVERLYRVVVGSPNLDRGYEYWVNGIKNGDITIGECARYFFNTPEFKGQHLNDKDYVEKLYKSFFGYPI